MYLKYWIGGVTKCWGKSQLKTLFFKSYSYVSYCIFTLSNHVSCTGSLVFGLKIRHRLTVPTIFSGSTKSYHANFPWFQDNRWSARVVPNMLECAVNVRLQFCGLLRLIKQVRSLCVRAYLHRQLLMCSGPGHNGRPWESRSRAVGCGSNHRTSTRIK